MQIHEGDIMGLIDNKVKILGSDVTEVAKLLMNEMVTEDSELITIYSGADTSEEDACALETYAGETFDMCEVMLHSGGQPLYYYLIAVE